MKNAFQPWPAIDTDEVDSGVLEVKMLWNKVWVEYYLVEIDYYTKENKRKTTSRAKRGKGENFSFRVPSSSSKDDIVMVKMIYFLKKEIMSPSEPLLPFLQI